MSSIRCGALKLSQLIVIVGVVLLAGRSAGESCNRCMSNGVACLDRTSFATCFNGVPTENVTPCSPSKICTQEARICVAPADDVGAACSADYCGRCEFSGGRYACLDETRYGFCFGDVQPDLDAVRPCIEGYVCSHESLQICEPASTVEPSCTQATTSTEATTTAAPATTTTVETTTTTVETTTTTVETTEDMPIIRTTVTTNAPESSANPTTTSTTNAPDSLTTPPTIPTTIPPTTATTSPTTATPNTPASTTIHAGLPTDPSAFCDGLQREGNFRRPGDSTCKEYIFCYLLSGQYLAQKLICSGYFHETTGECRTDKPDECQ